MEILPAIDLMDGQCVRLVQGDYKRRINYQDDPLRQVSLFRDAGARWIHVVDLDGAKIGRPVNTAVVAAIAGQKDMAVEVGGGVRDEDSIRLILDAGAERVIIGTKAVSDFTWFSAMTSKFPGRIALGLDARGLNIATHGWKEDSPQLLMEFTARVADLPLAAIIYTDITRDGMMEGPNIQDTRAVAEATRAPVIASGGVCRVEDVRELARLNIAGAIVGRALYEGTMDLAEAIKAAAGANASRS